MQNDTLRDSLAVGKDDAGSPACIKGEDVVAESTGRQFTFHIFSVSPHKLL